MKTNSIIKFACLMFMLVTIQVSCAQPQAQSVDITMTINYGLWEDGKDSWYDAISFSDNTPENPGRTRAQRKGRSFKTKVKRNKRLKWASAWAEGDTIQKPPKGTKIILINVTRNPANGGDFLMDEFWYDSEDNGVSINGGTRKKGFPVEGEERYIISFAIAQIDGSYDIYTVDPIIRGNE